MNWEAIGAVGEIIGAFGVILTLAYLAVQVRQNSSQLERSFEATRVAADDGIVRGHNDFRSLFVADPGVTDIYLRGLADLKSLDRGERYRFNRLMGHFGWTNWQMWRVESLVGDPNPELFRDWFCHPGARDWYRSYRQWFPPDYRATLDAAVALVEDAGVDSVGAGEPNSMFDGILQE